jgi:site-specific DNA-cytosine methylase
MFIYKRVTGEKWEKCRALTVDEMKRIQSFSADFLVNADAHELEYYTDLVSTGVKRRTLRITESARVRAMGNSVCPFIAREVVNNT